MSSGGMSIGEAANFLGHMPMGVSNTTHSMRSRAFTSKLLKLYDRFKYVRKTGKNKHFDYKFFQESVVKRKLNEACRELGLVVLATQVTPVGEVTGKAAVVRFSMTLADVDDTTQFVVLEGIGGGMDSGDKAPMKAVVSAFKYAIANGLMVETGDDPEADAATDDAAVDALLARIAACADRGALEFMKPDVAAFKGGARFGELRAMFKERAAALDRGGEDFVGVGLRGH